MKKNSKYNQVAIITSVLRIFSMDMIAEMMQECIDEQNKPLHIIEKKERGMTLKREREADVSEADVMKLMKQAIIKTINSDYDTFVVDISERYEFDFDGDMINIDLLENGINIKKNGNIFYLTVEY